MAIEQKPLLRPLGQLSGVGPERAGLLQRLDLHTVSDLLLHRPRRYEDRRHFQWIARMFLGEASLFRGRIMAAGTSRYRGGRRSLFQLIIDDDTGRLHSR